MLRGDLPNDDEFVTCPASTAANKLRVISFDGSQKAL